MKSAHQLFMTLTYGRYREMVKRIEGKQDKIGRKYGLRMQVPFTLDQYRNWTLEKLGGSEEGACQCVYCGRWLNVSTLVTDHAIPPGRGGGLGLDNLVACCEDDNDAKGESRHTSYMYLLRCLEQMPADDRANYLGRLKKSEKLAHSNRIQRARLMQQQKPKEVTAAAEPQF